MKSVEVVAAIIKKNKKILITQRGYGEFKGLWEFPGGKIEAGETKENALKREILEELNTTIEVKDFLCTVDYDYPNFHLKMYVYFAALVKGDLELKEHLDCKWIKDFEIKDSLLENSKIKFLPADIQILKAIQNKNNC